MSRAEAFADAYVLVAQTNHYLVRVDVSDATWDELCEAEQILIRSENADPRDFRTRALDLCERDCERARRRKVSEL
jgi:hypothetical protein